MEDSYAIPAEQDPIPAGEENILDDADIVQLCQASTGSRAALYAISYLMVIGWYILFRTAFESLTGGKTIAKFMNGTRAVNEDGTRITFKTALLRNLSRSVPFEAFSALGANPPYPWHDRWTRTYVIDEYQSRLPINP